MQIITTEDGSHSIESIEYQGVTYHSIHGAIQETQTVFIDAALHFKAAQQKQLHILEIGLGTGLNALMTYREALKNGYTVHYTAIEAYPLPAHVTEQLNYPQQLGDETLGNVLKNIHKNENQWVELSPQFHFYKRIALFQSLNEQNVYDVVYYDAFAPSAQPDLWEPEQFKRVFDAMKNGGVLTTYCAKGSVKRALKSVGFVIESLPGPKGKREMTRAIKN